jgi:hypothetical protein
MILFCIFLWAVANGHSGVAMALVLYWILS